MKKQLLGLITVLCIIVLSSSFAFAATKPLKINVHHKSTAKMLNVGIISSQKANLRSNASRKSKVLLVLNKGTKVTILEKANNWYKIRTSKGNIGWLYYTLLKVN
jgi:uncharacterized protein YgiM (DUF1202 family)